MANIYSIYYKFYALILYLFILLLINDVENINNIFIKEKHWFVIQCAKKNIKIKKQQWKQ